MKNRNIKNKFFTILTLLVLVSGCAANKSFKEANYLASMGDWDEAVELYAELHERYPKNLEYRIQYMNAKEEAALFYYNLGKDAVDASNHAEANMYFNSAVTLNPGLKIAKSSLIDIQKIMTSTSYYDKGMRALKSGQKSKAKKSFLKALAVDPNNKFVKKEIEKLAAKKGVIMGGYELSLKSDEPINKLRFNKARIKNIFQVLSRESGVNFIFDKDVRDETTSVYLEEATFEDALELILMTNRLARKVVNENTIIIYPNTPQKNQQYKEMMIKAFYLKNIEAKKAVNLLRTMTKIKDIFVHSELNALIVRATPDALELAERVLLATDREDAEVMLVVDIIEVNRNKELNIGVKLDPYSATLSLPSGTTTSESGVTSTTFGGPIGLSVLDGLSPMAAYLTVPNVTVNFKKENSNVNILANPKIRVKNNKKAKIHIGDRVPVVTSVLGSGGGTTESIQYLDVGIKLDVEPTIRPTGEIDLKMGLEVSSIVGEFTTGEGNTVFQVGTRKTETVLRLYDGETQIIGGLISDEERDTKVKIPGLGDIPIIGRLFTNKNKTNGKTDIVMSITPHIIREVDVPGLDEAVFWSGKESDPSSRPVVSSNSVNLNDIYVPEIRPNGEQEEPPPPPPPFMNFDQGGGFNPSGPGGSPFIP